MGYFDQVVEVGRMVSAPTAGSATHFHFHSRLHSCMTHLLVAPNSSHQQEVRQQPSGPSVVESPSAVEKVEGRRSTWA